MDRRVTIYELVEVSARHMGFKVKKAVKGLARNTIKLGLIVCSSIPQFDDEIIRGAYAVFEELSDFNVAFESCSVKQNTHNQGFVSFA